MQPVHDRLDWADRALLEAGAARDVDPARALRLVQQAGEVAAGTVAHVDAIAQAASAAARATGSHPVTDDSWTSSDSSWDSSSDSSGSSDSGSDGGGGSSAW